VLPYLQPAALTPHLRELARKHEVALKKLRADVAEATGTEQPETAPLRRIRPRDVAMTLALIADVRRPLIDEAGEQGGVMQ
jgi:hypothetical protein